MAETTEEIIIAANDASALLSSGAFRDAVQRVRDMIISEWASSAQVEKREDLHRKYVLLGDIIAALNTPIRKGRAVVEDMVN